MNKRAKYFSEAGLLYAAAIWGSTFFLVKQTLDHVHPLLIVAYRFILAAGIFALALLWKRKPLWKDVMPGFVMGFFLWLLYVSQTVGLLYTSSANSGFITGLFIIFIPAIQFFILRTTPSRQQMWALLLSLVGLWCLTGGLQGMNKGDVITLLAALTYALHVILADRYVKRNLDPLAMNFHQCLAVAVLSLVLAIFMQVPMAVPHRFAVGSIIFLAVFPTASAFLIQLIAQRHVEPVRVALILALEPVFAALFAWTIGGEVMLGRQVIGGLLIFTAMIMTELQSD